MSYDKQPAQRRYSVKSVVIATVGLLTLAPVASAASFSDSQIVPTGSSIITTSAPIKTESGDTAARTQIENVQSFNGTDVTFSDARFVNEVVSGPWLNDTYYRYESGTSASRYSVTYVRWYNTNTFRTACAKVETTLTNSTGRLDREWHTWYNGGWTSAPSATDRSRCENDSYGT
jgi:hypothetical protein